MKWTEEPPDLAYDLVVIRLASGANSALPLPAVVVGKAQPQRREVGLKADDHLIRLRCTL